MRLGIWTPLPHTIKSEPAIEQGIRQVGTRGDRTPDQSPAAERLLHGRLTTSSNSIGNATAARRQIKTLLNGG